MREATGGRVWMLSGQVPSRLLKFDFEALRVATLVEQKRGRSWRSLSCSMTDGIFEVLPAEVF
jgi:hypothetical protein